MITIKTGVPGSGKTQSMVAELLEMVKRMQKTGDYRPIYTNITGLDKTKVPHFELVDTKDWMACPPESIIVIDEAQEHGYAAASASQAVPKHISALALHRKDYAVDIWLISQHPKLLHVAARRQCGKHQHYERKFGMSRAFCFEWHHCEDQLGQKKTAVLTQFAFSKAAQAAYLSAEVHTKQSFKWPLWIWIPILAVPIGLYAAPNAITALHGSMTGKGLNLSDKAQVKTDTQVKPVASVPAVPSSAVRAAFVGPAAAPEPPAFAGCVRNESRCNCFTAGGAKVDVELDVCMSHTNNGQPVTDIAGFAPESTAWRVGRTVEDAEVLRWMVANRSSANKRPSEP